MPGKKRQNNDPEPDHRRRFFLTPTGTCAVSTPCVKIFFVSSYYAQATRNTSVKGFGIYGDIVIRDRTMNLAPTPFALTREAQDS
jgi:hypothetical protein